MQDKMFYKDLAFTGAKDFKSGKLGKIGRASCRERV